MSNTLLFCRDSLYSCFAKEPVLNANAATVCRRLFLDKL